MHVDCRLHQAINASNVTHLEMIRKVSERAHLGYQHEPGKKKLLESPGYQVNIISFTKKLKDKGENT